METIASSVEGDECEKHDFEIILGHANVKRYFLCQALQLPPEVTSFYIKLYIDLCYNKTDKNCLLSLTW
jgi:hypothetical protein